MVGLFSSPYQLPEIEVLSICIPTAPFTCQKNKIAHSVAFCALCTKFQGPVHVCKVCLYFKFNAFPYDQVLLRELMCREEDLN